MVWEGGGTVLGTPYEVVVAGKESRGTLYARRSGRARDRAKEESHRYLNSSTSSSPNGRDSSLLSMLRHAAFM